MVCVCGEYQSSFLLSHFELFHCSLIFIELPVCTSGKYYPITKLSLQNDPRLFKLGNVKIFPKLGHTNKGTNQNFQMIIIQSNLGTNTDLGI